MPDPISESPTAGNDQAARTAGPSQDMIERFAALDTGTPAAPQPAADPLAPTFTASSPQQSLAAFPDHPSASTRYTFEAIFASGGLGQIRRAYDHRLKRYVAVKELRRSIPGSASELRFRREALLTARLEHPSIVPIHDLGAHDTGDSYYCMKLVDGRTLDTIVAACKSLNERLALVPHVVAVADALAYAHENRIVHRDLKPGNVLVGSFGETVVIDWGLAKELSSEPEPHDESHPPALPPNTTNDLTCTGSFVGTIAFMPPEQAERGRADTRADVYAIGAMLYYTLSGYLPYQHSPAVNMLVALLEGPPPDLSTRVAGLPADLLAIVVKAMARNPDDRYPTARELAADLRRFQTGRLITARPYSFFALLRHFADRHRSIVRISGTALALLVATLVYSYTSIVAEKREADAQRNQAVLSNEAAKTAQAEAEKLAREARTSAVHLYIEAGRRELFEAKNPQAALVLLNEAFKADPGNVGLQYMLAPAAGSSDAMIQNLPVHEGGVTSLKYSASGRSLSTINGNGNASVWDSSTGAELAALPSHNDRIVETFFVAKHENEILAYTEQGRLFQYEINSGVIRSDVHPQWPEYSFRMPHQRPNFLGLLFGGHALFEDHIDGGSLWVVDIQSGALLRELRPESGPRSLMASEIIDNGTGIVAQYNSSPDGVSMPPDSVAFWDLLASDMAVIHRSAAEYPGGGLIVAADTRAIFLANQTYRGKTTIIPMVWSRASEKPRVLSSCDEMSGTSSPSVIATSSTGDDLFVLTWGNRIVRWSLKTGACEAISAVLPGSRMIYAGNPETGVIITDESSSIVRLNFSDLSFQGRFVGHAAPIQHAAIRPDAPQLATASVDGEIRLWSMRDPSRIYQASFRTGHDHSNLSMYETARRALRKPCSVQTLRPALERKRSGPRDSGFRYIEADGQVLANDADAEMTARLHHVNEHCDIWDLATGRRYDRMVSSSNNILLLPEALVDSAKRLLVSWYDGSLDFRARNGSATIDLPGIDLSEFYPGLIFSEITDALHRAWGYGLEYLTEWRPNYDLGLESDPRAPVGLLSEEAGSPDWSYIVRVTNGGGVTIHEMNTGALMATLRPESSLTPVSRSSECRMPAFSPDWGSFVTARPDGSWDLWDAMSFAQIATLKGHQKLVCAAEFDSSGTKLITFDPIGDESAFLWRLDESSNGTRFDGAAARVARFSPDGSIVATGEDSGRIRLWMSSTGEQINAFYGHNARIERLSFSEDGMVLYSMDARDNVSAWAIRRESRSPDEIAALIDEVVPYRLHNGRAVPK